MSRTLLISQFVETRLPLQQILEQTEGCKEVISTHSFDEASNTLHSLVPFDFVFIADSYDPVEMAEFVEMARKSRSTKNCTFVLVLQRDSGESTTVANNMLLGFHGFLCAPLSLKKVQDIMELATGVNKQESGDRIRAATGLMLNDIFTGLNSSTKNELSHGDLWERVQRSCEKYKELTGDSVTQAVVEELRSLPPSERTPGYTGVSARVKNLVETKLLKRLKKLGLG